MLIVYLIQQRIMLELPFTYSFHKAGVGRDAFTGIAEKISIFKPHESANNRPGTGRK